jgi:hypothetical protein
MHRAGRVMESVQANWKALRNGVIVSVIVLYLVEPTMNLALDVIPDFGGRFYRMVFDRAARQAALGGQYLDFALLAVAFSAVVGAVIARFAADSGFPRLFGKRGRKSAAPSRWDPRIVLLLFLAVTPAAATTLLVDFAAQQMKLSFHQRLAVLAPAISEETEESLRARFADLRDHGDYQSLSSDLDRIAREMHVDVPSPLL